MRIKPVLYLCAIVVGAVGLQAGQLTWDPAQNGSGAAGSGNWDTNTGNWYNGSADVSWIQTSTTAATQSAVFGGADGNYAVSLDGSQIAVTNLTVNSSGYVFSGANIYLATGNFLNLANNKTVTFQNNITGAANGAQYWPIGSGSILNLLGAIGPGTTQVRLAGPTNSAFYLAGNNTPSILYALAPVYITNGTSTISSTLYVGYNQTLPAPNSTTYAYGLLSISNATVNANGNVLIIGRSGGSGTLTMENNSSLNVGVTAAHPLAIVYDANAADNGTLNVNGGTLTVGSSSLTASTSAIDFFDTGETTGSTAVMTQTGGTVFAWGGLLFGASSGTAGTAALTNSGGFLYLGKNGMAANTVLPSLNIVLTGGTLGALASWSSPLPISLGNANGNTTFQCVDNNNNSFNISLSGPLTGAGGLNVTGGGTLTLSGSNNYAGNTVVSNGTLAIVTGAVPMMGGGVILDATAGSPTLAIEPSGAQYWTNNGSLVVQNATGGTPSLSFQYGALPPSSSVAPIQIGGNVSFAALPHIVIGGASVGAGTYPLIKYTGSVSGTAPTSVTAWSGSASAGYLTNLAASKTIALVVTTSSYNPGLYWAAGSGAWDVNNTADWTQSNSPAKYQDGDAVIFDDSSSGTSPINVTLNVPVAPLNVTFNNAAKNYSIAGSGSIGGSGALSVLGGGTATLATANTYSGGTILSSGQLNVNNSGSGSASAIGTGSLTINGGVLDNTSGADEVLQPVISETWNGNFAYAGASNSLNTGAGSVTMNNDTTITVGAHNLTIGGGISDNQNNLLLTKNGNGALTLATASSFGGGTTLNSGLLNLGDPGAAGAGALTINGGSIDNVSGSEMLLSQFSYVWGGNFSVLNSANLDFGFGNITVPVGPGSVTVDVVTNTMSTYGLIVSGNTLVIKNGAGTWNLFGNGAGENLQLTVAAGQVNFAKSSGQSVGIGTIGLTVQSGALVLDENSFQVHSDTLSTPVPVNLSGTWDLNGWSENVDKLSLSDGTLRVGAGGLNTGGTSSTLNLISGYTASLTGTNCQFDVESGETLNFKGPIGGTGSLVMTGAGTLNLSSNNIYTGGTVISNGTLALPGVGTLADTSGINLLTSSAILDLSANTISQTLTLNSGETLSGFGTVNGNVQSSSGATIAPGSATATGTLTVNGTGANALGGVTMMKLDKGHLTSDQLLTSGSLSYGGTLALANLSGSLAVGDSFTLFPGAASYGGAFSSISPATPGSGLAWDTSNLAVNGSIGIKVGPASPPGFSAFHLSGTMLSIQATNGVSGHQFVILTSTNVSTPVTNWIPVLTNTFDSSGDLSASINLTNSLQFLLIKTQ